MFFDVQIQSSVEMVDFGTRMLKTRTVYNLYSVW
jgi:hypothetical protein